MVSSKSFAWSRGVKQLTAGLVPTWGSHALFPHQSCLSCIKLWASCLHCDCEPVTGHLQLWGRRLVGCFSYTLMRQRWNRLLSGSASQAVVCVGCKPCCNPAAGGLRGIDTQHNDTACTHAALYRATQEPLPFLVRPIRI